MGPRVYLPRLFWAPDTISAEGPRPPPTVSCFQEDKLQLEWLAPVTTLTGV